MNRPRRCTIRELVDQGPDHYTPEEYRDCLVQLGRVGRWLGGNRASLAAFKDLDDPPRSVLDVGCGGGWFAAILARRYPAARVVGIDLSGQAIAFARERWERASLPNLSFEHKSLEDFGNSGERFDVVTATLVCHHFDDEPLIAFLKKACSMSKRAVILNDLHRHWLAYAGFSLAARLFFRNRLVIEDGPLSVRRSFKRRDWSYYLDRDEFAGVSWSVRWKPVFRWIVVMDALS
jgi:2-polyprenyl-3-methyl-5-hydroxy-6-metoxy-1,4-benzoquinol methylase